MCKLYTVGIFCACGGQLLEMNVRYQQIMGKATRFGVEHQSDACGPVSEEEAGRRWEEWREKQGEDS